MRQVSYTSRGLYCNPSRGEFADVKVLCALGLCGVAVVSPSEDYIRCMRLIVQVEDSIICLIKKWLAAGSVTSYAQGTCSERIAYKMY